MAQVGGEGNLLACGLNMETNGFGSIVKNRESLECEFSQGKWLLKPDFPERGGRYAGMRRKDALPDPGGSEHRQLVFLNQLIQSPHVIGVIVGDEHAQDGLHRYAQVFQVFADGGA